MAIDVQEFEPTTLSRGLQVAGERNNPARRSHPVQARIGCLRRRRICLKASELFSTIAAVFPDTTIGTGDAGRFATTRWSLILSSLGAESGDQKAKEALAQLCRIYWRPIFAYVRRRGRSKEDAQDLTQEFFLMILQGSVLQRANPDRGRFRSLLLKSLQNFLMDAHDKATARKRGGGAEFVSWDEWTAEAPSRLLLPIGAQDNWPAEKVFDVRWAATVAEQALRRLQEECETGGRRHVFDALSQYLTADREDISYESLAQQLGIKNAMVKGLLHRFRIRYRQLLRAAIADTVERDKDVDEELRYLVAALSAGMQSAGTA